MQIDHVIALCRSFEEANLRCWIDGGWGVDALLGEQTRPHSDLDLAVEHADLAAFQYMLELQGFVLVDRPDNPYWNLVLQHSSGRSVDLHGFVFNEQGNGVLGDPANGDMYPAGSLNGVGQLGGLQVRCVNPPFVLGFRNGFEPRDVDHHDVVALCTRFGLALPSRFRASDGSRHHSKQCSIYSERLSRRCPPFELSGGFVGGGRQLLEPIQRTVGWTIRTVLPRLRTV